MIYLQDLRIDVKILRIIARLNIGGPARNAVMLGGVLDSSFALLRTSLEQYWGAGEECGAGGRGRESS